MSEKIKGNTKFSQKNGRFEQINDVFLVSDFVLQECDSGRLPGSGREAAARPHPTLWMTTVTRPRGRAGGQSGQSVRSSVLLCTVLL